MKLLSVPIQTTYVKFGGGLDLISPVLSIKPGMCLSAMNYEPGIAGGYARIDGFERSDGRPSPSDAVYYYAAYTLTGTVAVGNTITGATSAATGYVMEVGTGFFTFTKLTGAFQVEQIKVGGTVQGTLTALPILNGQRLGYDDAVSLNAAADVYRADILKVNGAARPIRGIWIYKGVRYAFQDDAAGTGCDMYKSTTGGWTKVALGKELAFTSGGTYVLTVGDVITGETSAATATITGISLESGTYAAGTAAGHITFASQTGTFQAETIKVGANLNVANIAGDSVAITLSPLGVYEFVNYNFYGSTDTLKMYGCNGVNKAFEFDGTAFIFIRTGMTVDKPSHITAYKKQLFLSFYGSSQNSGVGTPYSWSPILGATEIGLGDTITGYAPQVNALIIYSRNSTNQLLGSSAADFVLSLISDRAGAIAGTIQTLSSTYGLDDQGVRRISRTQAYGNFDDVTVSARIQGLIDTIRTKVVTSSVYRPKSQYRLYGSDGSGLILSLEPGPTAYNADGVLGFTEFKYQVNVTCVCSGEDSTGKDVVFFGADNGYVYQADKGSSFDGEPIQAWLRLPFNNIQSPRVIKRYRKATLELSSVGYMSIRFQPDFSYGDPNVAPHILQTATEQGTGGYWDVDTWGTFFYDARTVNTPEFDITGSGLNMGLIFYSKSDIDQGHTLQGLLVSYTPRRIAR